MKMLYILNTTNQVNNFSNSAMIAAKQLGIEFHIAGNWTGYNNSKERIADEEKYGIKIHQIDFIRTPYDPRNIKAYTQVVRLIEKERFDVIHCNTPIGGVVGRLAGKRCGVNNIIYQAHGFHFYKGSPLFNWLIYYPIEKVLAKLTDVIITINKEDYIRAKKNFKLRNTGKVYYVPGVGIELSDYLNIVVDKEAQKIKLGINNNDNVMISVGELNKNKNNKVIIEAMAEIDNPHLHYLICGDGSYKKKLRNLVKKYGLDNNVHFLGYRTDVERLLILSDVFVMSSLREGLSRSIMEAMAVGKPCVVSDIRGNRDMIKNNKGGFLCKPSDAAMFSKSIEKILNNKELAFKMNKYNLNMIKQFEINAVIEKLKQVYKILVMTDTE